MTAKLHDKWHKQFIVGIRGTLRSTIIFSLHIIKGLNFVMEMQRAFLEERKCFGWAARGLIDAFRCHLSDNRCVSVASRAV
jgi:hypothetical protein